MDTTQSQLAHGLRMFACHPDQWELLAHEPERAAAAVEELVRFEPITPFTARLLHEAVEYRDVVFPQGTVVMVCAFSANRDGVEGEPAEFDMHRRAGTPSRSPSAPAFTIAWARTWHARSSRRR